METLKEKNPAAFKPKIDYNVVDEHKQKVEKTKHIRGCNCSKTQCLKKYCECYQSSVLCTNLCKCTDCKNDDIEKLKKKPKNSNVIFKTVSNDFDMEASTANTNLDKNSFSREFLNIPEKDIEKLSREGSREGTEIRQGRRSRLIIENKESEENEFSDEDDYNSQEEESNNESNEEDESSEEINIKLNKKGFSNQSSGKMLQRKRNRSPQELDEIPHTPKLTKGISGRKNNKEMGNSVQTCESTNLSTAKKRITKLSEVESNKIAKKLNLQV